MELGLDGVGERRRLDESRISEREGPEDDRQGLAENTERAEEDERDAGEGGGRMRLAMDEASTFSCWKPLSSSSSSDGICSLLSS